MRKGATTRWRAQRYTNLEGGGCRGCEKREEGRKKKKEEKKGRGGRKDRLLAHDVMTIGAREKKRGVRRYGQEAIGR